jgi:hypothetical protein
VEPRQIVVLLLIQSPVTQKLVKLNPYRVAALSQFRNSGKDVFSRVTIDKNGTGYSL